MDPRDEKVLACMHGLLHAVYEIVADLEDRTVTLEQARESLVCQSCGTTMVSQPLIMEKGSSPGDE